MSYYQVGELINLSDCAQTSEFRPLRVDLNQENTQSPTVFAMILKYLGAVAWLDMWSSLNRSATDVGGVDQPKNQ